jgi:hypothetical protein
MKEGVAVFDGLARMDLTIWLDVYTLFFLFLKDTLLSNIHLINV